MVRYKGACPTRLRKANQMMWKEGHSIPQYREDVNITMGGIWGSQPSSLSDVLFKFGMNNLWTGMKPSGGRSAGHRRIGLSGVLQDVAPLNILKLLYLQFPKSSKEEFCLVAD